MAEITFGNQVAGLESIWQPLANQKSASRYQNTSGQALVVSKLHAKWGTSLGGATKVKAFIYSDASGLPDTLLATSAERTGITGTGWYEFTFASPATIADGAYVWLGVISDSNCFGGAGLGAGNGGYRSNANTYASGPSGTFGSSTFTDKTHVFFVSGDDGTNRLGRASIDQIPGNYQPDREHADKFVLGGADSVDVTSISTYVQTTSGTVKSKAAIYNDNAGVPGTKVAQTNEVTGATANSWLELPFAAPVTLAPGTYWLTFICDTNLVTPVVPSGGFVHADGVENESTAWTSPAYTYVVDGTPSGIDIYASYTAAGGGGGSARPVVFVCT